MPFRFVTGNRKQVTGNENKSNVSRVTCHLSPAFTLIELLIVIVIVGILATMAIVVFNLAQAKGRDAKRKSDLDALKKALLFYKGDTKNASYFPKETTTPTECDDGTSTTGCIPKTALIYTGSPSYTLIKKIPKDPSTKKDYYYKAYLADSSTACTQVSPYTPSNTSTCVTFKLVACLENAGDRQKDASIDTTACGAAWTGSSYTVKSG